MLQRAPRMGGDVGLRIGREEALHDLQEPHGPLPVAGLVGDVQ
jgi:hypothetical protein